MKRCFLLIGGALLLTMIAAATEPPRYEAYAGFQYVRANQFNQNAGLATAIGGFSMYGGDGQFQYNFNKWISGVIDGGAVNKPGLAVPSLSTIPGGPAVVDVHVQNTTAFTFGGPRIYWRHGRWAPFGEVLFGGAFRRVSTGVIAVTSPATPFVPVVSPANLFPGPNAVVSARLSASENAFAMRVGGGLDYKLGKYFSVRPVEVDYILTRFPNLSTGFRENQSSIAASAGIIFTFGAL